MKMTLTPNLEQIHTAQDHFSEAISREASLRFLALIADSQQQRSTIIHMYRGLSLHERVAIMQDIDKDEKGREFWKSLPINQQILFLILAKDEEKALNKIRIAGTTENYTADSAKNLFSQIYSHLTSQELFYAVSSLVYELSSGIKQQGKALKFIAKYSTPSKILAHEVDFFEAPEFDLGKYSVVVGAFLLYKTGHSKKLLEFIVSGINNKQIQLDQLKIIRMKVFAQLSEQSLNSPKLSQQAKEILTSLLGNPKQISVSNYGNLINSFREDQVDVFVGKFLESLNEPKFSRDQAAWEMMEVLPNLAEPQSGVLKLLVLSSHRLIANNQFNAENRKVILARLPEVELMVNENIKYLSPNCLRLIASLLCTADTDIPVARLAFKILSSKQKSSFLNIYTEADLESHKLQFSSTGLKKLAFNLYDKLAPSELEEILPEFIKSHRKAGILALYLSLQNYFNYDSDQYLKSGLKSLASGSPLIAHSWVHFAIENHTQFKKNEVARMAFWILPKEFKSEIDLRALGLFSVACNLSSTSTFWRDGLDRLAANIDPTELNSRKAKLVIQMSKQGLNSAFNTNLFESIRSNLDDSPAAVGVFRKLLNGRNAASEI